MPDMPALDEMFAPAALILGLILGSFYNVCVHRYLTGQSIVLPGSHCPGCGHVLSWWENIPLISYVLLRGRCRACAARISPRYPLLEALSGLYALALALRFGPGLDWLFLMAMGGIYLVAAFIDLESFLLPDVLTLPAAILALAGSFLPGGPGIEGALIGAALGGGSFWLLSEFYLRARGVEGLGLGDVKLMLSVGAMCGWRGLPLAVVLGSLCALAASPLFLRGSADKGRTPIPFGPFLCLGAMLYVLIGEKIAAFIAS